MTPFLSSVSLARRLAKINNELREIQASLLSRLRANRFQAKVMRMERRARQR